MYQARILLQISLSLECTTYHVCPPTMRRIFHTWHALMPITHKQLKEGANPRTPRTKSTVLDKTPFHFGTYSRLDMNLLHVLHLTSIFHACVYAQNENLGCVRIVRVRIELVHAWQTVE